MRIECNIKKETHRNPSESHLNNIIDSLEDWIRNNFQCDGLHSYNITISDGDNFIVSSEYLRGFKDKNREEE